MEHSGYMSAQLLVVDDEANIRFTLHALLTRVGYNVTTASSGEEAIALLYQHSFDLLVADLKMPGIDGMQVVTTARSQQPDIAIIVLTGQGSLDTAVEGLHHGIFDYLLKTTDPAHMVERVKAGLSDRYHKRRQRELLNMVGTAVQELCYGDVTPPAETETPTTLNAHIPERLVKVGHLCLDTWRQIATFDGRTLLLTPTQFRVLLCLAESAGQMLTYQQIVSCAQGYDDTRELEASELVKPHIYHIRQKLEPDPRAPRYLLNVRGKGYMLQA